MKKQHGTTMNMKMVNTMRTMRRMNNARDARVTFCIVC